MNISDFTEREVDAIVAEWVDFARTALPEALLSDDELSDHAKALLLEIAADVRLGQGKQEKHEKSVGDAPRRSPELTHFGCRHAEQRYDHGFSLDHIVSEFRALRASVIRRWTEQSPPSTAEAFDELVRFGESMDQAQTASICLYSRKVDGSRNLLLGVLGHDLRNPLSVVSMTSRYLQATPLSEGQTQAVARISRSSERMKVMVSDLLDFTQTALNKPLPVSPQPCDLSKLAGNIVSEVVTVHPGCAVELLCEGDLKGVWDPERVGQLLSNLVSNAVQYGDPGKPVSVHVGAEPECVLVSIHNEGAAIPEAVLKTMFLPLHQTSEPSTEKFTGSSGLGLGLYIARAIALAHSGSLEVESNSEGTTFNVKLPRTPSQQKDAVALST